jgi:hypothetical protein
LPPLGSAGHLHPSRVTQVVTGLDMDFFSTAPVGNARHSSPASASHSTPTSPGLGGRGGADLRLSRLPNSLGGSFSAEGAQPSSNSLCVPPSVGVTVESPSAFHASGDSAPSACTRLSPNSSSPRPPLRETVRNSVVVESLFGSVSGEAKAVPAAVNPSANVHVHHTRWAQIFSAQTEAADVGNVRTSPFIHSARVAQVSTSDNQQGFPCAPVELSTRPSSSVARTTSSGRHVRTPTRYRRGSSWRRW